VSTWKKDSARATTYTGPTFHNSDTGADAVASYSEDDGLRIFLEIPQEGRPAAEYSLAEIRRLYRSLGVLIEKVSAEPKPINL
jgi:hypothetical protein